MAKVNFKKKNKKIKIITKIIITKWNECKNILTRMWKEMKKL